MSKKEIVKSLNSLARRMEKVAVDMDYYGGFAPWTQHLKELLGAAVICREWAHEILEETEQ